MGGRKDRPSFPVPPGRQSKLDDAPPVGPYPGKSAVPAIQASLPAVAQSQCLQPAWEMWILRKRRRSSVAAAQQFSRMPSHAPHAPARPLGGRASQQRDVRAREQA